MNGFFEWQEERLPIFWYYILMFSTILMKAYYVHVSFSFAKVYSNGTVFSRNIPLGSLPTVVRFNIELFWLYTVDYSMAVLLFLLLSY